MGSLLNGSIRSDLQTLMQQGRRLNTPAVGEGPTAARFRAEWPSTSRSVTQALQTLEALQRSSQEVIDDIIQAGSEGGVGGAGQPPPAPLINDLLGSIKGFFRPPPARFVPLGWVAWYAGHVSAPAQAVANWVAKDHERFAPRDALGRFVSPKGMGAWEEALSAVRGKNWVALPG